MDNCKYKFKTNKGITPEMTSDELYTMLRYIGVNWNQDIEAIILLAINRIDANNTASYQLSETQDEVKDKLDALFANEKSSIKDKVSDWDTESIDFSGAISACKLLEARYRDFKELGYFPSATNKDDFIEYYVNNEMLSQHNEKTEEELLQLAMLEVEKWPLTREDGRKFHTFAPMAFRAVVNSSTPASRLDSMGMALDEADEKGLGIISRFEEGRNLALVLLTSLTEDINLKCNSLLKSTNQKSKNLRLGKHLSTELAENIVEGVNRVGVHIDRIYIDGEGHVHVFNFKYSQKPSSDWSSAKRAKYNLELGIIKEVLRRNGINVEKASFYTIPIRIVYNENNKIIDLHIEGGDSTFINANISNSGTESPIAKNEPKLRSFFPKTEPQLNLNHVNLDANIEEALNFIRAVNPTIDIDRSGVLLSAKQYIKSEKNRSITESEDGTHYVVVLPSGMTLETKTLNDDELLELISEHITELSAKMPVIFDEITKAIENSYSLGHANFKDFGFKHNSAFLEDVLRPYFERNEKDKPHWVPIIHDTLSSLGIFLFQNVHTGLIDIVKASPLMLNQRIETTYNHQDNILGFYEMDMEGVTKMKSTYGDMEELLVISIVNSLVELLDHPKFGKMHIISPYFKGELKYDDVSFVVDEYSKIVNYLNNREDIGYKFSNRFNQSNFVNPIELIMQEMDSIQDYADIKTNGQQLKEALNLSAFKSAKTVSAQIHAMEHIISYLEDRVFSTNDLDKILDKSNRSAYHAMLVRIYNYATKFIADNTGFKHTQIKKFNTFKKYVLPYHSHPDENVRHIVNMYVREQDATAVDFQKVYNPIRHYLLTFYDDKGFSGTKLAVVGTAKDLFKNMFKIDPLTGKKTWEFVNPYDKSQCAEYNLSNEDITFLKRALFEFAKIRARAKGIKFTFSSAEDPKLQAFINDNKDTYFLVPLIRRSPDIKLDVLDSLRDKKRLLKKIVNSDNIAKTLSEMFSGHEYSMIDDAGKEASVYDYQLTNAMLLAESEEGRLIILNQHDEDYFETNIEYLLNEYIFALINYEHLKLVETKARAILFQMHMLAREVGPREAKIVEESVLEINDFLTINIYNKSIMSDFGKLVMSFMSPMKHMMSNLLIMGNLRAAFRDSFEGLMQNTLRTLAKFNTDLQTPKVYEAYSVVLKDIFSNDRMLNVVSELCLRYRLSNTDAAKINEGAKFGKGGMYNPTYLGYSTLRGPDFLNRMVLFVARCLQDGTFYAYSLDKDDNLVYNPEDDMRFRAFLKGLVNDENYKISKAAYFSAVREYNATHPEDQLISFDISKDRLPEPYTTQDIESFKEFASMIYGAYDKAMKAKYEHVALGLTFGIFSTWFNGTTAAWLRERGEYMTHFRTHDENGNILIAHNEAGNELYFDDDGQIIEKRKDGTYWNGDLLVDSSEGFVPVIAKIPIQVLGILRTLQDVWAVTKHDGISMEAYKRRILRYESNKANLRRVLTDILMMLLYGAIFGLIFTPAYKQHKKNKEADNFIANAGIELFYKGGINSFDNFFGPIAIAKYVINDVDPSAAKLNLLLVNQGMQVLMGKKSFDKFLYGNLPIFRSFQDSIDMIKKLTK